MRYAQILNGKVHWIFEDEITLEELGQQKFNLNQIHLVDITNLQDVQEGYDYDGVNFIAPTVPQPTQEEVIKSFTNTVQKHLDDTARQRNYDGILSLCTYATSTNATFAKEGQAGVAWRDSVWVKYYQIVDEVKNGTRATAPTVEELIAELPVFTWGD